MLNENKGYTCACTLDKKLNADNHTCQGKFTKIRKNIKSLKHYVCCINYIFLTKHKNIILDIKDKKHLLIFTNLSHKVRNYYHGLLGKPKETYNSLFITGVTSDPLSGILYRIAILPKI